MSDELRFLCPKCGTMHGVTWDSIVRHCVAVRHVEFDKRGRIMAITFHPAVSTSTIMNINNTAPAFDALSTQELAALAYNKQGKSEPRFPVPEEARS